MPFVLPKIKAADSMVDGNGRPTIKFLKFFNFDFARAIERNDAAQSALIQELADQLALIQQAQATAEAALDAANNNAGSKIVELAGFPGGATVSQSVPNVPTSPYLELEATLSGGTLDANASWTGQAEFTENNGTTTNVLYTVPVTVNSTGIMIGGEWEADSATVTFAGMGSYSGTVIYAVTITRTSGSNYVQGGTINGLLRITPAVV